MPSQEKIEWVDQLEETISDAPDMVFTSFKGLTVGELEELRVELYDNDASYKVVKNRLAKRAFRDVFEDNVKGQKQTETETDEGKTEAVDAELGDLSGVGPAKVEALEEAGLESIVDVLEAEVETLTDVKGIGESMAETIQSGADELASNQPEQTDDQADDDDPSASPSELDDIDQFLRGNTGIAFSGNGFVNTAKVVTDFSDEHENLDIKGGILEGSILDEDSVEDISELPTRRELLTQLASSLNSPIQALASFVNDPIQSLLNSLEQIKDQKEE